MQVVTTSIMLQNVCPLCVELRASAVQVGCSVIYPALLSPLVGFAVSSFVHKEWVITHLECIHIFRFLCYCIQVSYSLHSVTATILSTLIHMTILYGSLEWICGVSVIKYVYFCIVYSFIHCQDQLLAILLMVNWMILSLVQTVYQIRDVKLLRITDKDRWMGTLPWSV